MFSVEERSAAETFPTSSVLIGIQPLIMEHRDSDNPPTNVMNLNDPIYTLRAESMGLQLYFGYAPRVSYADSLTYFNAGAVIEGQYPIVRNPRFMLTIPLMLNTDYKQITSRFSSASQNDFQQSSALIGLGLQAHYRITQRIRVSIRGVPQYGFSVTSFSGSGGGVTKLEGNARFYVDRIFNRIGLVIGYDYNNHWYNLEQDQFNYRFTSNSFLIGISF